MKIIFVISDWEQVENISLHTGYTRPIKRRAVEIKLTEQQEQLLELHQLGIDGCHPIMEQIESISLLLE